MQSRIALELENALQTALHQVVRMHNDVNIAARNAWRMRCSSTHDLRERTY